MFNVNNLAETNVKITNNKLKLPKELETEYQEILYFFKTQNELYLYSENDIKLLINSIRNHFRKILNIKDFRRLERHLFGEMIEDVKVSKNNTITLSDKIIEYYNLRESVKLTRDKKHIKILKKEN